MPILSIYPIASGLLQFPVCTFNHHELFYLNSDHFSKAWFTGYLNPNFFFSFSFFLATLIFLSFHVLLRSLIGRLPTYLPEQWKILYLLNNHFSEWEYRDGGISPTAETLIVYIHSITNYATVAPHFSLLDCFWNKPVSR